jgi:hypothetical protein
MTLEKIKLDVLSHLQYERDERIPELIEMYGGDEQYVIDEIWGFESEFNEYKEYMEPEDDLITLHCNYIWECIANPEW